MRKFNSEDLVSIKKEFSDNPNITMKEYCKKNDVSISEALKDFGMEKSLGSYTYEELYKDYQTTTDGLQIRPVLDNWQRDEIIEAREASCIYPSIISATNKVDSTRVDSFYLERTVPAQDTLQLVAEGALIPTLDPISFNSKTIELHKHAGLIHLTYEICRSQKVDLAKKHIKKVGIKRGQDIDRDLIDVLLNGNTGTYLDRPIRKVANTVNYIDLLRPIIENEQYKPSFVLCNNETYLKVLADEDVKKATVFVNPTQTTGNLPNILGIPVKRTKILEDGVMIFVDKSVAVEMPTFWNTLVEHDKDITQQGFDIAISDYVGFNLIDPNAVTVLSIAKLGEMIVASAEGEKSGETLITGEVYYDNVSKIYYKTGTSATTVAYGDDVSTWTELPVNGVITPTTSHTTITLVQAVDGKAVATGTATIVKKA